MRQLKLRPYARLLTMLGDQLIRNERVALVELIKNAYDADASWVRVSFQEFDENFAPGPNARIVIEDDGVGMNEDTIENHWANPATPNKALEKQKKPRTKKGRVIQGEKGIGRFALLKLGRKIKMTTRPKRSPQEYEVKLDVSAYSADFLDGDDAPLFLDDLRISVKTIEPAHIIVPGDVSLGLNRARRPGHGTRIEISHLQGKWNRQRVDAVYEDLARLQPGFALRPEDEAHAEDLDPFELYIFRDDRYQPYQEEHQKELARLLRESPVFQIEGHYDNDEMLFRFRVNDEEHSIPLRDPQFAGLRLYKDAFVRKDKSDVLDDRNTECGSFRFRFFVFDLGITAEGKFALDKEERELIKNHRIYLYRDGIRVYPYGNKDDDWLQIDMHRGTVRAADFLSNDQTVGFVEITQEENPGLADKTSREGLVDSGNPTSDFVDVLQTFLAWVRHKPYARYLEKQKNKSDLEIFREKKVDSTLNAVLENELPAEARKQIQQVQREYQAERRYLVQRAESTEHLAGIGLSVETASHDLMLAMSTVTRSINSLLAQANRPGEIDRGFLQRELSSIAGGLSFIQSQMKDMQMLFKSTKQRKKSLRVREVLDKVIRLFQGVADKASVEISVEEVGSPLVVKTTDAVLLQVFLNLFDNAIYWLSTVSEPREILIRLDGEDNSLIFADSGPGVSSGDQEYIFEPFYTGKGEEGRGLGLYIARQLLDRHDYTIDLVTSKRDQLLKGANFHVSFVKGEE